MGYREKNKAEQETKMSPAQYKKMRGDLSLYQAPKLPKTGPPGPVFSGFVLPSFLFSQEWAIIPKEGDGGESKRKQ